MSNLGQVNRVSILILDDEHFVCENIKLKLERLSYKVEYVTTLTNSVKQACLLVKDHDYDVIFTDIKMPFINGLSFIRMLREEYEYKGKIFVVSGHDDFSYVRTAFKNGADDYLLKPISISALDEKLQKFTKDLGNKIDKNEDKNTATIARHHNIVEYAIEYIQDNYFNPDLDMNEVASHISVSYSHFSNLFRKETSTSFPSYLKNIRIQKSIELLADPCMNISDICYKVGFKYPQQFSRAFKSVTGVYPTQYRNDK